MTTEPVSCIAWLGVCVELAGSSELVLVELAKGIEPSEAVRRGDAEDGRAATLERMELAGDAELDRESVASGWIIESVRFKVRSQSPNENKISYRRSAAR